MIEPAVLAHAKNELLPVDGGHALVDSQFRSWTGATVPSEIDAELTPISSLSMARGNPDALVAGPRSDLYETSATDVTRPMLAVIEAKGHGGSTVGVRTAITQAHRHLDEVNLGFAAAPADAVQPIHHRLANELNVGLLGVEDNGTTRLPVKPRAVGASTTPATETVRFHARIGGTLPGKLKKNHPKNAVGYALATAVATDDIRNGVAIEAADDLCAEYVIKSVDDARNDAEALGYVVSKSSSVHLTERGRAAARTLDYSYGSLMQALETIKQYHGSSTRLIDSELDLGLVARSAILEYPPTTIVIDAIEQLAANGNRTPQVNDVAKAIAADNPEFAAELFLTPHQFQQDSIDVDGADPDVFDEESNYHTNTLFQYKAVLWHAGILTTKGIDSTNDLDFSREFDGQTWALEWTSDP